jgi:hypothetical protein
MDDGGRLSRRCHRPWNARRVGLMASAAAAEDDDDDDDDDVTASW